jgi:hypothetical protein
MPFRPTIPENITVHLGSPSSDAMNVTLPFSDYIKNVASSEIYPSWPEEALKANILAQISVAMNRVFTGFYRTSGYDFDITNSPAYDQTFIYQRDIYENISNVAVKRSTAPHFHLTCKRCRGMWIDLGYNLTAIIYYTGKSRVCRT